MRKNWLTRLERQYVQTLLDEIIQHVKMRDMKSCAAFVQHAIKSRRLSTSMLSPEVIAKFTQDGDRLLQQMLNRHAAYKSLPCPLRGNALHSKASTVGLLQRTMTVRVNASSGRSPTIWKVSHPGTAHARQRLHVPCRSHAQATGRA